MRKAAYFAIVSGEVDIEVMYWDPFMKEPTTREWLKVADGNKVRKMRKTAMTCRDELLLCHAYIEQTV